MLAVSGLTKRFGGFLAVNQISFEVREGEILGLIGPNGSGKTTTFNMIAGMLRPSSGSVRFKGFGVFSARNHAARQGRNPLTGVAIDVPARRQVHFKPSPSLRTAMENVG